MKNNIFDSRFKGVGVSIALFSMLFYFAMLYSFSTAAPDAVACTDGPMVVADAADLTAAVTCHAEETVKSSMTISITANIATLTQTTTISNPTVALTINGNGNSIDAENQSGIRPIDLVTGTVVINDLTIENGNPTSGDNGGGIQNFGTLTLNSVNVISNTTTGGGDGGGIENAIGATLILNNSLVADNSAGDDGGGIQSRAGTSLTINNSEISNNRASQESGGIGTLGTTIISGTSIVDNTASARNGGGIFVQATTVTIDNSEILSNTANLDGGGIHVNADGTLNMTHSTVANNTSETNTGGGINLNTAGSDATLENVTLSGNNAVSGTINNLGTMTITHVTIANNLADGLVSEGDFTLTNSIISGNPIECIASGTITAGSAVNLISDNGGNTCIVGGTVITATAGLAALADNGGFGETMAPTSSSPVIDAATDACVASDQRGVARTTPCELGAVELFGISIADAQVTEGTGATNVLTFTLTRTDTSVPTSVDVSTTGDTATSGTDFTALSNQTVTFDDGVATKDFAVAITTDTAVEGNETFTVTISNPSNGIISIDEATGTINDDDSATVTLTTDASQAEGDAGSTTYVYTATLDVDFDGGFDIDIATTGGSATAGSDYTANSGTLTFAGTASETQTFSVVVAGDTDTEPDETIVVSFGTVTTTIPALSSSLSTAGSPATGTIANDDAAELNMAVGSATVLEDVGTVPVTVTLSNSAAITVTVDVTATDGTATTSDDYSVVAQTLEFAPGETEKTFDVTIVDDTADEIDEDFSVSLVSPTAPVTLGSSSSLTMTITDNDGEPTVSLGSASYTVDENGSSVDVGLVLSNASGSVVTVTVQTADISSAAAGQDYVALDTTVSIPAGILTQTVTISITDDAIYEGNETFSVSLSSAGNATVGSTPAAIVTITEDDSAPRVSISSPTIDETDSTSQVSFVVSLTAASAIDTTINYTTVDGTATSGSDYVAKSGSLLIPAGQTSGTIIVVINGDTDAESDETFSVQLSSATGATIDPSSQTGTATITNDDGIFIFLPMIQR